MLKGKENFAKVFNDGLNNSGLAAKEKELYSSIFTTENSNAIGQPHAFCQHVLKFVLPYREEQMLKKRRNRRSVNDHLEIGSSCYCYYA